MVIRNSPGHTSVFINCSPEIDDKIKGCGHFLFLFSLSFSIKRQKVCQVKASNQDRPEINHTQALQLTRREFSLFNSSIGLLPPYHLQALLFFFRTESSSHQKHQKCCRTFSCLNIQTNKQVTKKLTLFGVNNKFIVKFRPGWCRFHPLLKF